MATYKTQHTMQENKTDGRKKNGGARPGAGARKKEVLAKKYTITLPPDVREQAVKIFGTVTKAVKYAVQVSMLRKH